MSPAMFLISSRDQEHSSILTCRVRTKLQALVDSRSWKIQCKSVVSVGELTEMSALDQARARSSDLSKRHVEKVVNVGMVDVAFSVDYVFCLDDLIANEGNLILLDLVGQSVADGVWDCFAARRIVAGVEDARVLRECRVEQDVVDSHPGLRW
jgi:hypothetical protein